RVQLYKKIRLLSHIIKILLSRDDNPHYDMKNHSTLFNNKKTIVLFKNDLSRFSSINKFSADELNQLIILLTSKVNDLMRSGSNRYEREVPLLIQAIEIANDMQPQMQSSLVNSSSAIHNFAP